MSTHKTEKNTTLDPEILQQLAEQAQAEGRTVDQLLNEAGRDYLDIKHTIAEMDSFVAMNRQEAIKNGWTERSISTMGGLFLIGSQALRTAIGSSHVWLAFANLVKA